VENENELIAQELSALAERFMRVENRVADLLTRITEVEKVNSRLEEAALTTARALAEVSGHWDAVYEAMRRRDPSQDGSKSS
jgi:predicted nuclease with TOPRIM domain